MYKEGLNFSQIHPFKGLCGIYRLSIGEHSYIGSSKNLYSRLYEHRTDLLKNRHTNPFLQKVVNKYGVESIVIDIIELCNKDIRIQREAYWIKELKSDMNLKDPVTCELSESSKKKLSESVRRGIEMGRYVQIFQTASIECYDYFGEYITTFSTKEEAAKACGITISDVTNCLGAYKHGTKTNGSSTGKAVNGYRFRYSCSRIEPMKFQVNPGRLGQIVRFYYEKEDGTMEVAFSSVRDCWEFFTKHCRDDKITIIPILKSRESWELRQKADNHNGSISETE